MSIQYILKAMRAKVGNPARKLVLIKLADNANDNGICFPSYQHISEHCEMSKRSVIEHIKVLETDGFLMKTHRKTTTGNQSNIYKLCFKKGSEESAPPSEDFAPPPSEKSARPSEKSSPPPSEKSAPITSHSFKPVNEPKKNTVKKLLSEFGIDDEDLQNDFISLRKSKKATITKTALNGFQREADKAGISIVDAIRYCIERNWQGFNADWYQPSGGNVFDHNSHQTFKTQGNYDTKHTIPQSEWESTDF